MSTTALSTEELEALEQRFADFDPATATMYTVDDADKPADVLLTEAVAARMFHERQADKVMREAVNAARAKGLSWNKIGITLGVTGEAARQRYAHA